MQARVGSKVTLRVRTLCTTRQTSSSKERYFMSRPFRPEGGLSSAAAARIVGETRPFGVAVVRPCAKVCVAGTAVVSSSGELVRHRVFAERVPVKVSPSAQLSDAEINRSKSSGDVDVMQTH